MSARLRAMNLVLRLLVKPRLRHTATPRQAQRDFARTARLIFRQPPFLRHAVSRAAACPLHWIRVGPVHPGRVVLYVHGGAYLSGSPITHRGLIGRLSEFTGIGFCAPEYRLLQQARFPAAFDDVCAAWLYLLDLGYRPDQIVLGGDSAGGGLMFAVLAWVLARGECPAGAFAMSPWVDLTLSGASVESNRRADPLIPRERMEEVVGLYLGDAARDDPRASPLFARFDGHVRVMIQVGDCEILFSDADRMAAHLRAAGCRVDLEIWPSVPHVWPILDGWLPEARAAQLQLAAFVHSCFETDRR